MPDNSKSGQRKNVDVHRVLVISQEAERKNDKNDLENIEIESFVFFFWALQCILERRNVHIAHERYSQVQCGF